jgi:cytochrome c-type biogenesis protein CcmH/NrfG
MFALSLRQYAGRRIPRVCLGALFVALASPSLTAQSALRRDGPALAATPTLSEALAALLVGADSAARAGRYDDAIVLLRRYRAQAPDSVQGLVALARTFAWAQRFRESVDVYEAAVRRLPNDHELRIAYATTLGWAGRYNESATVFRSTVNGPPAAVRAGERGLASVAGWRGNHSEALARWERLVASDSSDADAWTGLSHARRWMGNTRGAERAARTAVTLAPTDAEATRALDAARAAVGPTVEPQVLSIHDSDGNRSQFMSATAQIAAPWRGAVSVVASQRTAEYLAARGTGRTMRSVARWSTGGGVPVMFRAEGGVTQLNGRRSPLDTAAARTLAIVAVGATANVSQRITVSATAAHRPFDEIALLMVNGIAASSLDAATTVQLPASLRVSADASVTRFENGTANIRHAGSALAAFTPRPWVTFGAMRKMQRNSGMPQDGYFAPQEYQLTEGSVRLTRAREAGVMGALEIGVGSQRIALASVPPVTQATQRVTASVTWRPSYGFEISTTSSAGRMASPFTQTVGKYDYVSVGLQARLVMR